MTTEFQENIVCEYKSLKKAIGKSNQLSALAECCVAFANSQGGYLYIGYEDGQNEPPCEQKIKETELNEIVKRLRDLMDSVAILNPEIMTHENGGQYIKLYIPPSLKIIATTSSGKVFIRIGDSTCPISGHELTRLAAEKGTFQWELIASKISLDQADQASITEFLNDLRSSPKVSDFIKQKSSREILQFYQLITDNHYLTNLGVLWFGTPQQRARLSYPITVQYIAYNEREEKVRKKDWHFHQFGPKALLLDIEREAIELTYSTEVANGLFRREIPHYPKEVLRELLVNAIAHKRYTTSGDIFIEVYPDRLSITSPGGLPIGITKDNILHERQRRNPHLIQMMEALNLMEGEGSGFDLLYEKLVRDAKPLPEIESDFSKVTVTIFSNSTNAELISVLDYIGSHYQLTQKEYIALGIIAAQHKILSTQLAYKLQIPQEERMRNWISNLLEKNIIISRGLKKGTEYLLNPDLLSKAKLNIRPTFKIIEPLKLEALIEEGLKHNGPSNIAEIHAFMSEASYKDVSKVVYKMANEGILTVEGSKRYRTYSLAKKK